jgi:hypothetical protein
MIVINRFMKTRKKTKVARTKKIQIKPESCPRIFEIPEKSPRPKKPVARIEFISL